MNDLSASSRITYGAVPVQPAVVRRIRGLSDKALAWLFITPTIVLLLAINIFPLVWTIYLSFTNYRGQPGQCAGEVAGDRLVPDHTDRSGYLGGDAGDGAFRVLDRRHRDRAWVSVLPS
jgi:ABC-type sugar transport system permease subunit